MDDQTAKLHASSMAILTILIQSSERKVDALKDVRGLLFDIENQCDVEMNGKVQSTQLQEAIQKQIAMLRQVVAKVEAITETGAVLEVANQVEEAKRAIYIMHDTVDRYIREQMAKTDEVMKRG